MTVTLSLFAGAGAQFFDNNGNVLSGGKIYTYQAGTTTPLATYTTNSESAFHTNPIILDSAGRVPSGGEIWLQFGIGYKFVLKTSTDVLIATYDNIPSSVQPPAANDADSIMYEQGYTVTAGSFVVGKIYRIASVGTTDFTLIGATNNTVGTHFIATGVGTGTGTAELSQTVETKLSQIVSVNDFGAVGDGVTDDTAAIQAAIDSGVDNIYLPEGTYKVTTLNFTNKRGMTFYGSGKGISTGGITTSSNGSRLLTTATGTDVIYCYACKNMTFKDFIIETTGGKNNRDGISLNGCVMTIIDTVGIWGMGRHGIYADDTGTGFLGTYPVFIDKCHIQACVQDGINIVANSGATQMNAIIISDCELQQNLGSGARLWGANIVVRDSISEGNAEYGVYLANRLTSGAYSAYNVTITNVYFELNNLGHIYGKVGQFGTIQGLKIENNFGVFAEGQQATYVPVKFEQTGSSIENAIAGLSYESNVFQSATTGAASNTEADFGGAPNSASVIRVRRATQTSSSLPLYVEAARFVNLGAAYFDLGTQSKVLSGLLSAKGGSGITYTDLDKSANITVSGSHTFFPVDVPIGTNFDRYQIPVDTDSTAYSIRFQMLIRSNDSLGSYSNMQNVVISKSSAGSTVVSTGSLLQYTANTRKDIQNEADTVLRITVTWTATPSYFYIGNPTVYHS
jgi:hypothetical protein